MLVHENINAKSYNNVSVLLLCRSLQIFYKPGNLGMS